MVPVVLVNLGWSFGVHWSLRRSLVQPVDRTIVIRFTPKQRIRRGIHAMMFVRRLQLSVQEKYTVHGMMVEVTEAVAKHWHDIWGFLLRFCGGGRFVVGVSLYGFGCLFVGKIVAKTSSTPVGGVGK